MVDQVDIVAARSITKIKDTTGTVEAIVLDVHLKRRGPAPLPAVDGGVRTLGTEHAVLVPSSVVELGDQVAPGILRRTLTFVG